MQKHRVLATSIAHLHRRVLAPFLISFLVLGMLLPAAPPARGATSLDWVETKGPGSADAAALAYDPGSGLMFAATYEHGVWVNKDSDWKSTGGAISASTVTDMAYDPSRNRIYAGTRGYGVWYALTHYPVTTSVPGGHGSVSPASQDAAIGGTASLDIIPDPGYRIASITDNGVPQTVTDPYVVSGVTGDRHVTVTFEVDPAAKTTFYFAEGYTGPGFQEYLCLGNPGGTQATAAITYLYKDGTTRQGEVAIPPNSRATVNVNGEAGADKEVSLMVTSQQSIVAERPMYFNYQGKWTGGHDAVGATTPSYICYFAEGYTGSGFEEWVCVLNPGDSPANLTFYFQTQEEGLKTVDGLSVPPHSRGSFRANDLLGGKSYQTSLTLTSDTPIVAERPTYFDYTGTGGWHWEGGHCVMGATTLWRQYYFAEGTTRAGFEEWLTIQNPGPTEISVNAVYQLGPGQGDPVPATYTVPPSSRRTVYVPGEVGSDKDVSIYLSSPSPFLAERPTYFNYSYRDLSAQGGHCVIGASGPASEWFLAEGYTGSGFNQWLCLQNPGDSDATVEVTYYTQEKGALEPKQVSVPAHSRNTLMVNEHAGSGYQLSTRVKVISGPPIVVERPMYFIYSGWDGGHDVVGYTP